MCTDQAFLNVKINFVTLEKGRFKVKAKMEIHNHNYIYYNHIYYMTYLCIHNLPLMTNVLSLIDLEEYRISQLIRIILNM